MTTERLRVGMETLTPEQAKREYKYNPKDDPGKVIDAFVEDGYLWIKVKYRLSGIEYLGRKLSNLPPTAAGRD